MNCDKHLEEWGIWLTSLGRAPGTISLRLSHVRRFFRETCRGLEDRGAGPVLRVVGKGGHVRVVPVPPRIAARIREAPGWVFPGAVGGHISAGWLGKLMSRALPAGVTPHQLRHSYGTRAYSSTGDLLAVQHLLGHSTPSTTQVYVQVSSLAVLEAARAGWRIVPRGLNVSSS